jgi:prepilin-type processing-associated H-X9-DG protein
MNYFVGEAWNSIGASQEEKPSGGRGPSGWRIYLRASDMVGLSPADVWVILDDHPDSVKKLTFKAPPWEPRTWLNNLPASYHGGGATLLFADGHSAFKKWRASATTQPVRYLPWLVTEFPDWRERFADQTDFLWLTQRATELY